MSKLIGPPNARCEWQAYLAAQEVHCRVYRDFGWPSTELELANRQTSRTAGELRSKLGLGPFEPLPIISC